jgi:hypothetical protein
MVHIVGKWRADHSPRLMEQATRFTSLEVANAEWRDYFAFFLLHDLYEVKRNY